MIVYKDRAFCCSPHCTNECGRQLTDEVQEGARKAGLPISTMYFCGISPRVDAEEREARSRRSDAKEGRA